MRTVQQKKSYSLIPIRQNYNFDILATIWHEIFSWFLSISQDFPGFPRICATWSLNCFCFDFHISTEQFYDHSKQELVKTGGNINQQTMPCQKSVTQVTFDFFTSWTNAMCPFNFPFGILLPTWIVSRCNFKYLVLLNFPLQILHSNCLVPSWMIEFLDEQRKWAS